MATSDKSWLCTDRPRAPHWDPELCLSVPSYSVDASEIADLHVISYEVERDLIPLILSNCQYQVEQGGETLQVRACCVSGTQVFSTAVISVVIPILYIKAQRMTLFLSHAVGPGENQVA